MASGVQISDHVVSFFNEMKLQKGGDKRVRLATFEFAEKCISVDKIHRQEDLDTQKMDAYELFMTLLDANKCRYIVYDCHFATSESSTKEELVFIMWCPMDATPKEKLNYAASKEVLTKKLDGIKHNLQINELSDCVNRASFSELLGKTITSLEGVPLSM